MVRNLFHVFFFVFLLNSESKAQFSDDGMEIANLD